MSSTKRYSANGRKTIVIFSISLQPVTMCTLRQMHWQHYLSRYWQKLGSPSQELCLWGDTWWFKFKGFTWHFWLSCTFSVILHMTWKKMSRHECIITYRQRCYFACGGSSNLPRDMRLTWSDIWSDQFHNLIRYNIYCRDWDCQSATLQGDVPKINSKKVSIYDKISFLCSKCPIHVVVTNISAKFFTENWVPERFAG